MCCMGHRVNNLSVTLHNGRRLDLLWWSLCNAQEYYITVPGTWKSRSVVGQLCFKKDERKKRKKEEGEESSVYTVKCFYYTHTHTHTRAHELDLVLTLTLQSSSRIISLTWGSPKRAIPMVSFLFWPSLKSVARLSWMFCMSNSSKTLCT